MGKDGKKGSRSQSTSRASHQANIMKAAEEVFAKRGFEGASMDLVAEKAGISKQSLIYYVSSKEELYQSILKNILESWLEGMTLLEQDGEDPAAMMENYIQGKVELSRLRPNASRVFAQELISGGERISGYLATRLNPQLEKDVLLVRSWIAAGKMDPVDPIHLFISIWAATQTYADFSAQIEVILGKKQLAVDDFNAAADFITTMVLKGIGLRR